MKLLVSGLILGWLLLSSSVCGDPIDDMVNISMKERHIPGIAIGIMRKGEIVKIAGYGKANLENNVPVSQKSVFKLASVSKHFIAAGVLKLVEEGKVSLDDSIRKHLTDAPESWQPITVRQLLSHTSGLAREIQGWSPLENYTEEQLTAAAFQTPFRSKPGEKHEYCNTGYFVLGFLISKISGMPWSKFLEEKFFRPLQMASTRTTTDRELIPNRVDGYIWNGKTWFRSGPLMSVRTSGSLVSSMEDLAKWEKALSEGKVLSAKSILEAWSQQSTNDGKKFDYGFGWIVKSVKGNKIVEHGGAYEGFRTLYRRNLDSGLTIIVLLNEARANPAEIVDSISQTLEQK